MAKVNPYQKQFEAAMERVSAEGKMSIADMLIFKEYKSAQKAIDYVSPVSKVVGGVKEVAGVAKTILGVLGGS